MTRNHSSYTTVHSATGCSFNVTPAPSVSAGFSFARLVLSFFPASFGLGVLAMPVASVLGHWSASLPMQVLWLVGFVYVWRLCYRILSRWILNAEARARHGYEADLTVSAQGIGVARDKAFIARDSIHRIVIRNSYSNAVEVPMSSIAVMGSAPLVGAAVAANAVGNAMATVMNMKLRAAAVHGFYISVEAGGVAHIIAGGLSEVCAFGLMTDIDRALNR